VGGQGAYQTAGLVDWDGGGDSLLGRDGVARGRNDKRLGLGDGFCVGSLGSVHAVDGLRGCVKGWMNGERGGGYVVEWCPRLKEVLVSCLVVGR